MSKPSTTGPARLQDSPSTLGDVLYAKLKPKVLERDWAALVQSIASGDELALHALYRMSHRFVFRIISSEYSIGFSQQRPREWGWALPFAAQLSKPTTVDFGRKRETIKVRSSGFHYRLHSHEGLIVRRWPEDARPHNSSAVVCTALTR
jgi:hypothetical protein